MQNGDVYIAGVGGYDGTNPSSASTLQTVVNSKADTNHAKVADATASGKILASTGNGTYSWQNISSLSVASASNATNATNANNAVYAGHAITAGKLGSSTVGSSTIPIYLNSGQPSAITSFPEAYLSWGGQNIVNGFGPMDAALVPDLGACRTAFITPSCISAEYSRDGGSTWSSYSLTNEEKSNLFNGIGSSVRIGNNTTQGTDFINYQVRVIFNSIPESGLYTVLNKFIIYVGEEGCERSWCTIDARTQANVTNNVDTWDTFADQVQVAGWNGYNVINTNGICTYANSSSQYAQIRFTFGTNYIYDNNYLGLKVIKILGYGGVGWVTPSNLARNGHLYSYDNNQNAYFPADVRSDTLVKANGFVKYNGTSNQFLKADGSVDSNTYLSSTNIKTINNQSIIGSGSIQTKTLWGRDLLLDPPEDMESDVFDGYDTILLGYDGTQSGDARWSYKGGSIDYIGWVEGEKAPISLFQVFVKPEGSTDIIGKGKVLNYQIDINQNTGDATCVVDVDVNVIVNNINGETEHHILRIIEIISEGSPTSTIKEIGNSVVSGSGISNIVSLTQQDYDGIITKDPNTLYLIK